MYIELKRGAMEGEMREVNRLVLKIFRYLSSAGRLTPRAFQSALGQDDWLMSYYEGLSPRLKELMKEPQTERQRIYEALEHDMEFDRHMDDGGFVFEEKNLSGEQTGKVKELILYLYERPFREGKIQVQGTRISYGGFKSSLFQDNRRDVCPACLGRQNDLEAYGDVDHYLPKARYPALIFHPGNLAVICGECNGLRVKREKDTLAQGDLTEIYIPYLRAAEGEAELAVLGEAAERHLGLRAVVPSDKTDKRIRNLTELFDLEKRWAGRLSSCFAGQIAWMKEVDDETKAECRLKERAEQTRLEAEELKYMLPEAACMEFLCGDGREVIMDEWRRRREEMRKLQKPPSRNIS